MDTRRQPSDTTGGRIALRPDRRAKPRRAPRHGFRMLVAVCLLIAGLADAAHGQTGEEHTPTPDELPEARWAVQPSGPAGPGNRDWFIYTLEPGAVFGDVVAVSNLSDRPIDFVIYPSDVGAVADVGGLAPAREEVEPADVGSWIELAASEYTVQPGTRIDVPFSITIPEDAEPGDHVGAIIAIDAAEAVVDPEDGDDVAFQVRQRIGARVYVRVEGPHDPALEVTQLSISHDNPVLPTGSTATVAWEITNTGNLRLTPQATMKIKGFLGRTVKTVLLPEIPELLPGGNFVALSIVEDLPPLERFTAELEVTALEVETRRSKAFWPVPWLLLLLLLLPIGRMLYRWHRRRKARPSAVVEPPPATPRKELAGV